MSDWGFVMALDGYTDQTMSRQAMRAELLDAETELTLARAWRDRRDEAALHRLVTAYMRLAISMAAKFRRYGAPMNDLIQEASLGLMKAADKFDPDRGVRFSTYAVWWIKASIQDYVMRNWSMVRTGSTASCAATAASSPFLGGVPGFGGVFLLDEMDAAEEPGYASRAGQAIRACNAYLDGGQKAAIVLREKNVSSND